MPSQWPGINTTRLSDLEHPPRTEALFQKNKTSLVSSKSLVGRDRGGSEGRGKTWTQPNKLLQGQPHTYKGKLIVFDGGSA